MAILSISQQPGSGPNRHQIAVEAEVPGLQRLSFNREIEFALSPQDGERIRWYLEDYLQFDEDPAPQIADARRKADGGARRGAVSRDLRGRETTPSGFGRMSSRICPRRGSRSRPSIAEATAIPWELIRNPNAGVNLALSAQAFVRSQQGGQTSLAPAAVADKVRILLVICRPAGGDDVPFRSVAGRLVKGLSDSDREAFELDVLRPPTYEQLAKVLRLAKEKGEPYHIVHFDGHGVYADPEDARRRGSKLQQCDAEGRDEGPARLSWASRTRTARAEAKFVDGFKVGGLLRDTGVPILILNACQSAFAEAPDRSRTKNAPARARRSRPTARWRRR